MIFEINAIPSAVQVPEVPLGVSYANDVLSLFIGMPLGALSRSPHDAFYRLPLRCAFFLHFPKVEAVQDRAGSVPCLWERW